MLLEPDIHKKDESRKIRIETLGLDMSLIPRFGIIRKMNPGK